MRTNLIFTIIIVLFSSFQIIGQGMDFFHGTWDEALQEAQKEGKLIFVDSYTKWCGPCRRMQKNIFPTKKAGDFYNKHFINVKMDMETQEGMKFGITYPVGAYPTFFYISPKGKVVFTKKGGRDIERFIEMGKNALKSYDRTPDYKIEWEKGNRDYDFVLKYIKELNNAEKTTNKVALEYLRAKPDISKDQEVTSAINEQNVQINNMMTNIHANIAYNSLR